MDYTKIYYQLIKRAKCRNQQGYVESHHIIPRCIGGGDSSDNLVNLTAKEHYIVHRLLTEIYPQSIELRYAFWMMCSMKADNQQRYQVSARVYEYAKSLILTKSEDHKAKIRESLKQAYASGKRESSRGRKMPKSFGEAISQGKKGMIGTNLGIPMTAQQKKKISSTLSGHKVKQDTRDKISQNLKNKPEQTCPHCNKSSRGTAFNFYHFDSCKFKK